MKIQKYLSRIGAIIIGAAAPLMLAVGQAHAAPLTCTWTGGGSDSKFSTAANWSNCNSAAPLSGDSLIFDGSASNKAPNNDISSLSLNNITFSNAAGFTISGVGFTVTGGITDNSTGTSSNNTFANSVVFTGNQSITGTQTQALVFGTNSTPTVTISSGTLTVSSSGGVTFNSVLTGAGNLTFSGSTGTFNTAVNNFTGTITIGSGSDINADPSLLGTAPIVVSDGGSLFLSSTQASVTLNNPITMTGTGVASRGAIFFTGASGGKLTLAGAVTLTGNTTIDPTGSAVFITGAYNKNGFTLTLASGTLTIGSGTSGSSAPKAPNTGLAAVQSNPIVVLAITTAAALFLGFLAFRSRGAKTNTRRR